MKANDPPDTKISEEKNLLFYKTGGGAVQIQVTYRDESFWLSQKTMAELFAVGVPAINKHLKSIFDSGELVQERTISKMEIVRQEGSRKVARTVEHYNLDAIIAVGYRVNSYQATQFRIWATQTLKEYIIKGFVLDDERLKQGKTFGHDYFEELLERIREIRASERRFYQKITDIYALSADYDKSAPTTKEFFATVQNKLHWAITGQTAAERIASRANADAPNMGLSTWKNAPAGKILKSDVGVAKNYLEEEELKELNRIVSAYLDLAENRAERRIAMNMAEWAKFLDQFLQLSDYPVLQNKGKVSALTAKIRAEAEFDKFRVRQDHEYISDFDQEVQKLTDQVKGKTE